MRQFVFELKVNCTVSSGVQIPTQTIKLHMPELFGIGPTLTRKNRDKNRDKTGVGTQLK